MDNDEFTDGSYVGFIEGKWSNEAEMIKCLVAVQALVPLRLREDCDDLGIKINFSAGTDPDEPVSLLKIASCSSLATELGVQHVVKSMNAVSVDFPTMVFRRLDVGDEELCSRWSRFVEGSKETICGPDV